nr:DUF746 domain-containing protein [Burkholderia sola]
MNARSSHPTLRRSDTAGEDKELTAFLTAQLDRILSASHEPRPRCSRCGCGHITSAGLTLTARLTREFDELNSLSHRPPHCTDCGSHQTRFDECPNGAFPRFKCTNCGTKFTRRRGTPFVNTKMSSLERMRLFIRHLSLPLSVMQVADLVGTSHGMVQKWHNMFIEFADRLEPSGSLSTPIRLSVKPTAATPCPFCGRVGSAQQVDGRGWACAGCGRLFSMRREVADRNGRLQIVADEA